MWGEAALHGLQDAGQRAGRDHRRPRAGHGKIVELGFPLHCAGYKPVDSRGRGLVIDYDCPVEAGGVLVHPGDVVFADRDGVVVIPQAVLEETIALASRKVNGENHTRRELLEGKLLRDVYEKYGVL